MRDILGQADLVTLRHGAFERVRLGDGRRSERLTADGAAAADAVGRLLVDSGREVVCYTSPQPRAVATAKRITDLVDRSVHVDPDLAELRLGLPPDAEVAITAAAWARARQQPAVAPAIGAETLEEAGRRVLVSLRGAVVANPGRLVLAVTHGGVMEALLATLTASDGCGSDAEVPFCAVHPWRLDVEGAFRLVPIRSGRAG